jgi:DNA invertase Pin-like site-specific DNA recombinase
MLQIPNFTGRLFGYERVSTEDQNLELQTNALTSAGVDPDLIFTDKMSGATMNRPGFKALMRAVRPGDCVVVWKLDRLGRSMIGLIDTVETFKNAGIHFRILTHNIDTTGPAGALTLHIFMAFAEFERKLISERTKAGVERAKARGVVFGRQHYILAHPKRLKALHKLAVNGELQGMSPIEVINAMNDADKKAPQYKHPQSYINWYQQGFPGLKEALRLADLDMPSGLPKPKKRKAR